MFKKGKSGSHVLMLCGGLSLMALTGCSASSCDVEVYLDPQLKAVYGQVPTLETDIAGVNAEQAQRLQQINLDQYFTPGSPQRRALDPVTMRFSEDHPGPMVLADSDELWDKWETRGAMFIAVICNLPILHTDPDAAKNPPAAQATPAALAGNMAEQANENSAVFNDGRVLLINMHDGFLKDSSTHYIQIGADGLITLNDRPDDALSAPLPPNARNAVKISNVQDLKRLEQQRKEQEVLRQLDAAQKTGLPPAAPLDPGSGNQTVGAATGAAAAATAATAGAASNPAAAAGLPLLNLPGADFFNNDQKAPETTANGAVPDKPAAVRAAPPPLEDTPTVRRRKAQGDWPEDYNNTQDQFNPAAIPQRSSFPQG